MENTPLVTIVTPAYNQAEYLAEAIESVLAQDYPNVEYIVIDDGSTDSTAAVLARYDGRIKWLSQANCGQAATLNRGWSLAQGTILGYLSSDDLLAPNAISILVKTLQSQPDAVVVYCDFDLIDNNGGPIRKVKTEDFLRIRLIEDLVCQPGPGALFLKSAFYVAGGWNVNLRQIPDFEFWTRMSLYGNFIRAPVPLANCRVHSESASFRKMSFERADEILTVVSNETYPLQGHARRRAMGAASLVSAKRHISSARYLLGGYRWCHALLLRPDLVVKLGTWKMLGSALFRRIVYSSRARPAKQSNLGS
ncbi:MAG: hypothetical protein COW59_10255 [Lysobacterales bacterium CG17_big_fil_post_rev_8_21_14_2_50_64_11]|nr:MAG: hypothetical protein COW59_10255 [Xanthomonadales bacterium CG17_big_fil_post_rev_8_21_14_2_50_64_11]